MFLGSIELIAGEYLFSAVFSRVVVRVLQE